MIKIVMNDLLNAVPVLKELSGRNFVGAVTFKIARLIRELDKEIALFDEARENIVEKYAVRKEDGSIDINEMGIIKIIDGQTEACNQELGSLLNAEIEVNADKIPADAFDNIEFSPSQALVIEALIDF
jgi:hypothetical protein